METLRAANLTDFKKGKTIDWQNKTIDHVQELLTYRNEELTTKLKSEKKYLDLEKWLDDNGVLRPGVEYPVAFGRNGELVGFAAKQDIPPQTAFVFVPQELHINEQNIRIRAPYFGEFIDRNPELFRKHYDAVYMPMIIYMWHE
jgi:hypothetical protein